MDTGYYQFQEEKKKIEKTSALEYDTIYYAGKSNRFISNFFGTFWLMGTIVIFNCTELWDVALHLNLLGDSERIKNLG